MHITFAFPKKKLFKKKQNYRNFTLRDSDDVNIVAFDVNKRDIVVGHNWRQSSFFFSVHDHFRKPKNGKNWLKDKLSVE